MQPGSNADIKSFAKKNYGVTFPLMSKVDVNGQGGEHRSAVPVTAVNTQHTLCRPAMKVSQQHPSTWRPQVLQVTLNPCPHVSVSQHSCSVLSAMQRTLCSPG